jgi:hypothetical protein
VSPQIHPEHHGSDNSQTAAPNSVQGRTGDINIADRALSVVAIIFSCLALGAIVMHAILYPQIIDAKIQAGIAKAEATSHAADTNARVALDEVERMREALGRQHINIPKHD